MTSKRDRFSETERFIELWQSEESPRNIFFQKQPFADVLQKTPLEVAFGYLANIRSGKKSKNVIEEYRKERIFFIYKYLSLSNKQEGRTTSTFLL